MASDERKHIHYGSIEHKERERLNRLEEETKKRLERLKEEKGDVKEEKEGAKDVREEEEKPWVHQTMSQSRSASPSSVPFSLLRKNFE